MGKIVLNKLLTASPTINEKHVVNEVLVSLNYTMSKKTDSKKNANPIKKGDSIIPHKK